MSRRLAAVASMAMLILAACAPGTGAPSTGSGIPNPTAPVASSTASAEGSIAANPTVAPATPASPSGPPSSAPPASASAAAVTCAETARAGAVAVAVRIEDFSFTPDAIRVRVGQVIRFTNTGFESHNATVDGGCHTKTLATGGHDGLVFEAAGSVAFHCSIHTWMTGNITAG